MPTVAVKERPLLFSGPMVLAILAGKKSVTRRLVKPQPNPVFEETRPQIGAGRWTLDYRCFWGGYPNRPPRELLDSIPCPWEIGMHLWVRETFLLREAGKSVVYRADMGAVEAAGFGAMYGGWKPSIFMPRWASRLTLEVVSVRVERLRGMHWKAEEFEAEGFDLPPTELWPHENRASKLETQFVKLWDKLNPKHKWATSPWCWRVEFRKVEP